MTDSSRSVLSVAQDDEGRELPGLSRVIAIRSLLVISVGMVGYAVIEYSMVSPPKFSTFAIDHILHVVLVAMAVWLVCWVTFENAVRGPIQTLYLQLYRIGSGRLEKLSLKSHVREMQMLVSGINLLARRLGQKAPTSEFANARRRLREIRDLVRSIPGVDADRTAPILRVVSQLEEECFRARHPQKVRPEQ